jgi:hypothetical protein
MEQVAFVTSFRSGRGWMTMKNVAFASSGPWEFSPLNHGKCRFGAVCDREMNTMRNVAFDLSAYEVRPAGPPEMHGSGAIVALHIGAGLTMKNVVLGRFLSLNGYHEKCRFGRSGCMKTYRPRQRTRSARERCSCGLCTERVGSP